MESSDWIARDAAVVWHGFTQMAAYQANAPIIVDRARGHELIDVDGNHYLDAISSLWVTTLGHRVPELDAALAEQAAKVAHSTLLGHGNRTLIELAEALAEIVPVDQPHFLFASDGASAVEQALKIAFQYWMNVGEEQRTSYLAFGGAYHGDTVGGMSLGAGGFGTDLFDPLRFPVMRAPGFDRSDCMEVAAALTREHSGELAAVVVEPLVQGAAGIQTLPASAFAPLQDACRETGVLLICDEIATGFGRTGTLFAADQCGLAPDLMCLGKGITGGYLPLSATAASRRVYDAFLGDDLGPKTLYHGHSYGGNALAGAVALRHLELIEKHDVLANVQLRSRQLKDLLERRVQPLGSVTGIRIAGLMAGVDVAAGNHAGRRVCVACVRRGVLLRPLGDTVVIMPPLTVTATEVERITDALAESIEEISAA